MFELGGFSQVDGLKSIFIFSMNLKVLLVCVDYFYELQSDKICLFSWHSIKIMFKDVLLEPFVSFLSIQPLKRLTWMVGSFLMR